MPSQRIHQIDAIRGLAVLLVIIQHAQGATQMFLNELAGGTLPSSPFQHLDTIADPFRVATLLMLSGLFLEHSLRKGLYNYSIGKVRAIVWPLALWTVITVIATWTPRQPLTLVELATGYRHLWFLVALVLAYAIGISVKWLHPALVATFLLVAAMFGGSLLGPLQKIAFWAFFFFLGSVLARSGPWIRRSGRWIGIGTGILALATSLLMLLGSLGSLPQRWTSWAVTLPENPLSMLSTAPALVFVVWVMHRLPRIAFLEAMGRRSLVYYLSHMITIALVTRFWFMSGAAPSAALMWIALVSALVVAMALERNYGRVRWLFEMPPRLLPAAGPRQARGSVAPDGDHGARPA